MLCARRFIPSWAVRAHQPPPSTARITNRRGQDPRGGGLVGSDAGKRIKGRKRHLTVDVEGVPIVMVIQLASVQDRDCAPVVILGTLAKAPEVRGLGAAGGSTEPKLRAARKEDGRPDRDHPQAQAIKDFTILYRRWLVERTSTWPSRYRRPVPDAPGGARAYC